MIMAVASTGDARNSVFPLVLFHIQMACLIFYSISKTCFLWIDITNGTIALNWFSAGGIYGTSSLILDSAVH